MIKKSALLAASAAFALGAFASAPASAADLKSIGITVGSLGNPFFVQVVKGAEARAKQTVGGNVTVTAVSADTRRSAMRRRAPRTRRDGPSIWM